MGLGNLGIGVAGTVLLFVLLAARMPVGFAMALVGFLGFVALNSWDAGFAVLGMEAFKTGSTYGLSVIPLFVLMGQFANSSEMGADIYRSLYRWVGRLPGGLAMATIGACACFAAVSGSSLATAATMGMVALPEMKRFHYADSLATGCVAAGGTLGILIPPSTVLIIYGILAQQPIGTLFIAGVVPGLLLTLLFMLTIYVQARLKPDMGPPGPSFTLGERVRSLKDTWGMLALFVLVIGGLYTGWFTPSEAGGVGAFGAFAITLLKGRLDLATLKSALRSSALTTAMIFTILIGANIFQFFITLSQIPDALSAWVLGLGLGRHSVMALLMLAFVILGCFMEGLSIMLLTIPIVLPIIIDLGFDPIWFGIMITLVMEMSLITPPVGLNVFIISGVAPDVPMYTIFRGITPFWVALLACIVILMIFPEVATFLPQSMAN